ncbi:MAG: hypothetical protein IK055_10635 [Lachnospiraceae bacterium]|nr:hypothetical protein [Lachnospiraceae bacterium]
MGFVRAALVYTAVAVSVAMFGAVYESFSFGVYSYWMIYAFAVPLVLGTIPALWLAASGARIRIPLLSRKLWHAGIAVWTVGALFTGVLAIYGTGSNWSYAYAAAGWILLVSAVFGVLPGLFRRNAEKQQQQ